MKRKMNKASRKRMRQRKAMKSRLISTSRSMWHRRRRMIVQMITKTRNKWKMKIIVLKEEMKLKRALRLKAL